MTNSRQERVRVREDEPRGRGDVRRGLPREGHQVGRDRRPEARAHGPREGRHARLGPQGGPRAPEVRARQRGQGGVQQTAVPLPSRFAFQCCDFSQLTELSNHSEMYIFQGDQVWQLSCCCTADFWSVNSNVEMLLEIRNKCDCC